MLTTTELRWFYRGTLPPAIADWFAADTLGEYLQTPEERSDVYLYVPECEYLGIKLRQKRLEIKLRKAELGGWQFGDNLHGKAEKWVKWSCEDSTGETLLPPDVLKKAPWVSVKKVRQQRKYQISQNGSIQPVPLNESITEGCNVEITQLTIKENDWWSLAFEAYGEDANLIDNLKTVLNWMLKNYTNSPLQIDNSFAYPKWLSLAV